MSFSKAKIQRFNDVKAYTPSPAKYNVATQEKIILGVISKPGSVKKSASPPHSQAGSVHSTPCFQTPTLPLKRKKLLGLSFKGAKTDKSIGQEELRDKIVECNNKDLYIKDLLEQIEDMTGMLNNMKKSYEKVKDEKEECEGILLNLRKQQTEERLQRAKEYKVIDHNLKEVNDEMKRVRQECEDFKCQNLLDLSKVLSYIGHFEQLVNRTVEETRQEVEEKVRQFQQKEELMKIQHKEELRLLRIKEEQFDREMTAIKSKHSEEEEEIRKKLTEAEAKVQLLEENFKDVNVLTELQMEEKIAELERAWKQKLEAKEKEYEAILKECQAISEYNIIQCEIEKNQIKSMLEEKEKSCEEISSKNQKLEEEMGFLKTEKHAYELSISTFKDTIEVLKKRLFSSDRDVEQLKEELENSEEKILSYERKVMELTTQLNEVQMANEELEMQYESTSKLMQSQVKTIEKSLLRKVDGLKEESKELEKNKELLAELLQQQQMVIAETQSTIADSSFVIQNLEEKEMELEAELKIYKLKLSEESEEAAEIRKKYIEKSGKYDELAHQFEQILQELDVTKAKVQQLEKLTRPLQEELATCQNALKLVGEEKLTMEKEIQELTAKYTELLGHQNHNQKIKHVQDLRVKSSELFQKNIDLENKNQKLHKKLEQLMKEVDDLKKPGKKTKDKENFGSPKVAKGTQSPCPLKDKN